MTAQTVARDSAGRVRLTAAVAVGLLAGFISLGRLWLRDSSAASQILWAEDGLFPLCIHKADFFTCTTQPFAGYLLFVPRVLAWPVSVLPLEQWALAANVIAALLAGVVAALVFVFVRRSGAGWFVAGLIALLPVIAPMSGLEAINAIGSSYMLLLYLATIGIVVGQPTRAWWWVVAVVGLVTALTIPSAIVLLPLVLVQFLRGRIPGFSALVVGAGVTVGLVAQALTALTAQTPRPITINGVTLSSWADSVPISLLTYWPGLSLGEFSFFSNFTLTPFPATGWLVVAVLTVVGVVLIARGWSHSDRLVTVGLLILAGLAFGLIPSAIGDTNNRYFVVPVLLWGAAILIALDPVIRRSRWWVTALVAGVVLVVWWPAMPASEFRGTPAPPWTGEVERLKAACRDDPAKLERPVLSPFWPPNWGDGLDEPTHPDIPCTTAYRWIQ